MTAYATWDDVEVVWRALTDDEHDAVTRRLEQASRIIRQRVLRIDARISDGSLDADLVRDIAVDMVVRYLRNPEGWREESIEDYSRTRDSALSSGGIYLTPDELALLGPRSGTAFSIKPTVDAATLAHHEQIAAHRAAWREP